MSGIGVFLGRHRLLALDEAELATLQAACTNLGIRTRRDSKLGDLHLESPLAGRTVVLDPGDERAATLAREAGAALAAAGARLAPAGGELPEVLVRLSVRGDQPGFRASYGLFRAPAGRQLGQSLVGALSAATGLPGTVQFRWSTATGARAAVELDLGVPGAEAGEIPDRDQLLAGALAAGVLRFLAPPELGEVLARLSGRAPGKHTGHRPPATGDDRKRDKEAPDLAPFLAATLLLAARGAAPPDEKPDRPLELEPTGVELVEVRPRKTCPRPREEPCGTDPEPGARLYGPLPPQAGAEEPAAGDAAGPVDLPGADLPAPGPGEGGAVPPAGAAKPRAGPGKPGAGPGKARSRAPGYNPFAPPGATRLFAFRVVDDGRSGFFTAPAAAKLAPDSPPANATVAAPLPPAGLPDSPGPPPLRPIGGAQPRPPRPAKPHWTRG